MIQSDEQQYKHKMNLELSFEQLSITEDTPPRRPHLVRLNAQREITCHDPPPPTSSSSSSNTNGGKDKVPSGSIRDDEDDKTLENVFSQAQRRFPPPRSLQQECDEMSLASMGAQELEFYWQPQPSNSTHSLNTTGSHRRRVVLQRHPTPPHLLRTLTMSSHHQGRPHNPVAGLWRQSSLLTNDSCGSAQSRSRPPSFFSSRHSSTRTFASQDTS